MASIEAIAVRELEAQRKVLEVLERHDPEAVRKLDLIGGVPGVPPNSLKQPHEFSAWTMEAVATLAHLVDKQLTPRKRGRPRKSQ